ncbi:MAG: hypothetical protein NC489_34535 [Ruminococcus flavefaciens]|nr:hypothetical protein [Ruminococcus flavefaciens]
MSKVKKYISLAVIVFIVFLIIYMDVKNTPGILKEIEKGKFFLIDDAKIEEQLGSMFSSEPCHVAWIWRDLNSDGILELILAEKKAPERIIGIFSALGNKVSIVLWDDVDVTEYYELCESGLLYYSQYYGIYDQERYMLYRYDIDWTKELVEGLEVYWIEDVDNAEVNLDELPFAIDAKSDYYLVFQREEGKEHYKELTREEWLKEFISLFGRAYQGMMLRYQYYS